ncbi:unnamed protein product [Spirodela intermedia]|uniref:Uncharacterized protein n=2 Tax=Spirodela intermedia TaxID=51605 RepID=A0ABN7ECC9_SPIIN|nr:unnamed protein product [Spirodela intermedia]CAA7405800.1 unnamed protein product [Spirodela intermedia]
MPTTKSHFYACLWKGTSRNIKMQMTFQFPAKYNIL